MLLPSMHLMSWDVRAIIPFDVDEDLAELRRMLKAEQPGAPLT